MKDLRDKIRELQSRIEKLRALNERAHKVGQYSEATRVLIESLIQELLELTEGKENWINYSIKETIHSELVFQICSISERMIQEYEVWVIEWKKDLALLEAQQNKKNI